MSDVNTFAFVAGLLLLMGIASSKFSTRIGMPVLVLFLGVGMLAGSDGPGGIPFDDYRAANGIASIALALILFDGGLRTSLSSLRSIWRPALVLSTVGVLVTSVVTGLAAAHILGVPPLYGMLLGGIVGSTDAAAVFSVLRTSGIKLPERLESTLEVESGSNDPMAIFLTVGVIQIITGATGTAAEVGLLLLTQFGVGAAVGLGAGYAGALAINRVHLEYTGLYPVLATAFGLLSFGLGAVLGGSGFLAVYLAGIVIGNRAVAFRSAILYFHDAAAWLGQMGLFVMLGLLSFPSRLPGVAPEGLLIALVLTLVARPAGVLLSLLPFRFSARELVLLSWVGLKGAVPITLATFPLMAGIEHGALIFDVVFFVVLVSAVTQGWSLPALAGRLDLGRPADPPPPVTVEINALRNMDGEIVEYTVAPSARVAGQRLRDVALPDGVLVTLLVRGEDVVMPRGGTALRPGDHVFVAMRKGLVPLMDRLFDPNAETPDLQPGLELAFHRSSTVGQLHRFFGIPGPTWSTQQLGTLVDEAGGEPVPLGPFLISPTPGEDDFVMLRYGGESGDRVSG